jgi:hypothetical protein
MWVYSGDPNAAGWQVHFLEKNTVDGQNPVPVGTVTIGNYETQ